MPGTAFTWTVHGQDIPVGLETDLALNALVLAFIRHPHAQQLLTAYETTLRR